MSGAPGGYSYDVDDIRNAANAFFDDPIDTAEAQQIMDLAQVLGAPYDAVLNDLLAEHANRENEHNEILSRLNDAETERTAIKNDTEGILSELGDLDPATESEVEALLDDIDSLDSAQARTIVTNVVQNELGPVEGSLNSLEGDVGTILGLVQSYDPATADQVRNIVQSEVGSLDAATPADVQNAINAINQVGGKVDSLAGDISGIETLLNSVENDTSDIADVLARLGAIETLVKDTRNDVDSGFDQIDNRIDQGILEMIRQGILPQQYMFSQMAEDRVDDAQEYADTVSQLAYQMWNPAHVDYLTRSNSAAYKDGLENVQKVVGSIMMNDKIEEFLQYSESTGVHPQELITTFNAYAQALDEHQRAEEMEDTNPFDLSDANVLRRLTEQGGEYPEPFTDPRDVVHGNWDTKEDYAKELGNVWRTVTRSGLDYIAQHSESIEPLLDDETEEELLSYLGENGEALEAVAESTTHGNNDTRKWATMHYVRHHVTQFYDALAGAEEQDDLERASQHLAHAYNIDFIEGMLDGDIEAGETGYF